MTDPLIDIFTSKPVLILPQEDSQALVNELGSHIQVINGKLRFDRESEKGKSVFNMLHSPQIGQEYPFGSYSFVMRSKLDEVVDEDEAGPDNRREVMLVEVNKNFEFTITASMLPGQQTTFSGLLISCGYCAYFEIDEEGEE